MSRVSIPEHPGLSTDERAVHLDTAAWAAGIQGAAIRQQASGHRLRIAGWILLGLTVCLSVVIAATQDDFPGNAAVIILVLMPPALGLLNVEVMRRQRRRQTTRMASLLHALATQEPCPVAMRLSAEGIVLCVVPGECGPLIPWDAVRGCRRSGRMLSIRFDRVAWPEGRGKVSYNVRYLAEDPASVVAAIQGGMASA